jgi:hypothetical protein
VKGEVKRIVLASVIAIAYASRCSSFLMLKLDSFCCTMSPEQMESSMRKAALSQDWFKVEEDAPESIASSAIIISTASVEKSGKKAVPKKRGRPSIVAKAPSLTAYDGACFGVKWWRGGTLSRRVYNWESLTKSALRRAGRRGILAHVWLLHFLI